MADIEWVWTDGEGTIVPDMEYDPYKITTGDYFYKDTRRCTPSTMFTPNEYLCKSPSCIENGIECPLFKTCRQKYDLRRMEYVR